MEKEKIFKVNFGRIEVQMTFEGDPVWVDMRKDLGNRIHQNTGDIGMDELARSIYFSEGEVDIPQSRVPELMQIVRNGYTVPAQQALEKLFNTKTE